MSNIRRLDSRASSWRTSSRSTTLTSILACKRVTNDVSADFFIRFVLHTRDRDSGVEEGLFRIAYFLRDAAGVADEDRRVLREVLQWFERNLATPDRFNRSRSKGFYRRATRGIAWFKSSATECLRHMHRMREVLEKYSYPVTMLSETRSATSCTRTTFRWWRNRSQTLEPGDRSGGAAFAGLA